METERTKKSSAGIIFALMVGYSIIYMDKNMISTAMIPIAKTFHLDAGQQGLVMSFFFLGYSLMQIPGGWLADKIGAKKVLILSLSIVALFSFAFGSVSSLLLFMFIRFFAGVGHGGYPPSVSKSVAENFPQHRRTFVQSLILSTSGIGPILAFTIGANIISWYWRYAYVALGLFFLTAAILVAIFVPSKENESKEQTDAPPKVPFSKVITNRNIWVLFIAMLLLNILLFGNVAWLPSYLTQEFGLDLKVASYLLAINAVFQTGATMFVGVLLSKLFLGKERQFIMGATTISALLVVAFVLSKNLILSMILLIVISMISVSAFTAIFTWPHKIFDSTVIGSSIGIINTGGTLGGFLSPLILGWLIKTTGGSFTAAFVFMAVASLFCGVSVLGVKKEKK